MKMTHPETKVIVEVDEDNAEPYLSQGWVEKGAKPAPEDK